MAYYNKEDVRKYIIDNNNKIEGRGHKSITPIEHSISQLDTEDDIVGFFWMDISDDDKNETKVKMSGKTFVRVDFDIYTDDRFAIDLYQSQVESTTVSDIIKGRMVQQELARKSIDENKEKLDDVLSKGLLKKK